MKRLLIATHNPGKLALYETYFSHMPFQLISLNNLDISYDVPETGMTFEENAQLKAEEYSKISGILTLADDGGLEVDALNGEPGIYSARYAGSHATDAQKVQFLLNKMESVPEHKRSAQFVVVLALVEPRIDVKIFRGVMKGSISLCPRGKPQKGLPYRQIFVPQGFDKTLDELDELGIMNYQNHRQIALGKMIDYVNNICTI